MLITTPLVPLLKKLNPLWWFGNQFDSIDAEPKFLPTYPWLIRVILWGIRNPLENFARTVIGFWDQGAVAKGSWPYGDWNPDGTVWNFLWVTPKTQFGAGWLKFPFVSHRGTSIEWYAGWDWAGKFGFSFRIAKAN